MSLTRFIKAQENTYDNALSEIKAGQKRSHWMWFIFPQLRGLGYSDMAYRYGIKDLKEAQSYLQDAVLGQRLEEICHVLLNLSNTDANKIFGYPDYLKLHSSMTLFSIACQKEQNTFASIIDKYFNGEPDSKTRALLRK